MDTLFENQIFVDVFLVEDYMSKLLYERSCSMLFS